MDYLVGGAADMIERSDATASLLRVLGPCQVERDQQPRGHTEIQRFTITRRAE